MTEDDPPEFSPYVGSGISNGAALNRVLRAIPERQLRAWMKKARDDGGGVYRPRGWGRDFTVANMSAELAQRRRDDD